MSSTIYYKKYVEWHFKNGENDRLEFKYKKYFLLCGTCCWMASTLPIISEISSIKYKKCPICTNDVYKYLICDESF